METTRSERIKIGAFMLLCGIMICVFLGYVLSRFLNKEFDNYYTVFSESVIGLYTDAQVKLNGIDVGNVTGIEIDSSNLSQVVVRFRVNKGTPIKIGTRAGMTHGISLTGEKQIVLSGGRFDEPDVAEGGFVPAEKTAFDEMANKATDIISHIDSLLTNINKIFSSENAENISSAIKNFEGASRNLNNMTQNLNKPINNISNAAASMKNVLAEIEEAKIAAKTSENMDLVKEKIAAIDTKSMNENITQTLESINQLSKRLDQMVYKNQDQVGDAVVELNAVLENLEEFSQKIKNNPSALIHAENKSRRK
ncbi:phospholipid/cholesterol/gamma-HCH transport system substrate-binding protein [Fibrobacter sp. UWB15]|jgi:phospholipid/cholesterol/gamma-HCH transport system substrate-binding protein|uniref:MlaD family protein n=1 Tax=unclassified Fibrobacter TaxID=2634177 RepID=UPI000918FCC4|nr:MULTISPECIES: MlaD family protein [unclassified Fibrobacter]PWJ67956.1 phospholipid/cholesterol/gamma-HCH transport system substrate-binding protein [Fibrobacter sp. UWB6]SHF82952.1 phospholipid/cholesterol/gamma-HCH transport system substrate-binding protein [Fibrobacter sp. UWB8]SMG16797.1 phospholipid/cholesterol/gamma-HCH transport system substrate-binding protein [Fibrobacter sp. UWB15]